MSKIIITEFMDENAIALLKKQHDVIYDKNLFEKIDELKTLIPNADAIIVRNKTQVTKEIIKIAKNLKVIGRLGVGLDNIDTEYCKTKNIPVIIAKGANGISVAEYVLTGILYFSRQYFLSNQIKNGIWAREQMIGSECSQKTLGLVGFGNIAQTVAKKTHCLDLKLCAYDPFIKKSDPIWKDYGGKEVFPCSLEELIQQSDYISLHIPLTPDTKNLFNKEFLQKIKKNAVLINTSRGGIIDEKALAELLQNKHLKGAMLDVFEHEPLSQDNYFKNIDNCLLTPHIAGVTHESNTRISFFIAHQVLEILE